MFPLEKPYILLLSAVFDYSVFSLHASITKPTSTLQCPATAASPTPLHETHFCLPTPTTATSDPLPTPASTLPFADWAHRLVERQNPYDKFLASGLDRFLASGLLNRFLASGLDRHFTYDKFGLLSRFIAAGLDHFDLLLHRSRRRRGKDDVATGGILAGEDDGGGRGNKVG
ncbi:hypothetical protein L1887_19922 [Cichorium endivia]|nr:hypothetical protein L1887_19922 [Cichorium endivia]